MTPTNRPPDRSVFFELFALTQAARQLLLTTMADGPLSPEEYAVYSAVFEAESLTPTAVARQLSMPLTTVMERVRVMEERGHVRRVPNPRDGRSYLLVLSAAGLAAHRGANRRFEVAYRAFVDALDADEREAQESLARLRVAASAAAGHLARGGRRADRA